MIDHKRGIWFWQIMGINQVETFVYPNLIWLTNDYCEQEQLPNNGGDRPRKR